MISFRERNNIDFDAKPEKRRCVYCGRNFTTISGRLCCRDCVKLTYEQREKKFDELVARGKK